MLHHIRVSIFHLCALSLLCLLLCLLLGSPLPIYPLSLLYFSLPLHSSPSFLILSPFLPPFPLSSSPLFLPLFLFPSSFPSAFFPPLLTSSLCHLPFFSHKQFCLKCTHTYKSRYILIDLVRGHGSRDVGPQWDAIDPNTRDLTDNACFASGW